MFYKQITDGYICAIGENLGGTEITETEYNTIIGTIHNQPTPQVGYDYRLKADLTWELYELPPVEENERSEITLDDALEMLRELGVEV